MSVTHFAFTCLLLSIILFVCISPLFFSYTAIAVLVKEGPDISAPDTILAYLLSV